MREQSARQTAHMTMMRDSQLLKDYEPEDQKHCYDLDQSYMGGGNYDSSPYGTSRRDTDMS